MNAQKRIKQLMEERGWTDYRLAKESGLSHSTVTNMFNRNNAPTLPTLEAVCRAFGITLAQFFSEGNEPNSLTEELVRMRKHIYCHFSPFDRMWKHINRDFALIL